MVDIEIVKENFRRMSDEQLKRFAKLEADKLSLEAFHALKDELESRNIDLSIIEDFEDIDIPEKRAENAITNVYVNSLFDFAIDEKANGISDADIYHSLIAKRLNPDQAFMILQMLEETAKNTLENIESNIAGSWFAFFAGVALFFLGFNSFGSLLFIGALVIIAVSIRLADTYAYKKKILQVLENCKNEEDAGVKDLYQ